MKCVLSSDLTDVRYVTVSLLSQNWVLMMHSPVQMIYSVVRRQHVSVCLSVYVHYTDLLLCVTVSTTHSTNQIIIIIIIIHFSLSPLSLSTIPLPFIQFTQIIPTTDCQPHPPHCSFDSFLVLFWSFYVCVYIYFFYILISRDRGLSVCNRWCVTDGLHWLESITAFDQWKQVTECFSSEVEITLPLSELIIALKLIIDFNNHFWLAECVDNGADCQVILSKIN